jgi:hypothetical protein
MVERTIKIEKLQKGFTVGIKDAHRQKRNRSFSNASNCCGKKVKQLKKCSVCDGDVVATECTRKIVKIGKEEHLMNAQALKQITENLAQQDEIVVHTFIEGTPQEAQDRFEGLAYATPVLKKQGEYIELREILKGRTAIGRAVFRGNEYEVLISVGTDDRIRIRKLVEQGQLYDVPNVEADAPVNQQIIDMEKEILAKNTESTYDFTQFRDTRAETEEQLIEDVVLHGKQPEVTEVVKEVAQKNDNEELERLQALMGE